MSDCLTQNKSNESLETSVVKKAMDSVSQQQSTQQSPNPQLIIGQQVSPIVTPIDGTQSDHNSNNELSHQSSSSANTSVSVSIISSNASEPQNSMTSAPNLSVTSSSMPSASVSGELSSQTPILTSSSQSQQLIVSSSQPQLVATTQSGHMNVSNGLMAQSLGPTITSMANQTIQMTQQSQQHNQMQPMIQTSVQTPNQMNVQMSALPQVQVIQQPMGATAGTYQLQQVYPQQMILPGNLTIQNMPFGAPNQGLSLQIPFSGTGGVSTGTMPITSIAAKTPIMSKGVAISPLPQTQHQMISSLKQNVGTHGTQQFIKQVLPAQLPHSTNQTVVFSPILPNQTQHHLHQSILPNNRGLLEAPKGKPFSTGTMRSSFGNKMLSHSGAIQPKSTILPATSISSSLIANAGFKSPFPHNANTTQLIQTPQSLLNSQILGSFQALPSGFTWNTSPQSTHLVAPNGSPIFIRGPTQGGEHMFISTSNMSSPHIQTVSMATPINTVQNAGAVQVNASHTQQMHMTSQPIATSIQHMPAVSSITTTTTAVNTSQPSVIAPAITQTVTKPRNIRQASSSVATQTAAPVVKPPVDSTSTLKPIAPAKPKSSPQSIPSNVKPVTKDSNTTPMRSTSVGTTQTVSQPTTQSNKTDAFTQQSKVSVGTETIKPNVPNQVTSSRVVSDQNRPLTVKTNSSSDLSQPKVNSVPEEVKTPMKRVVEKKDASSGEDTDVMSNIVFAQQNHKLVSNSVQTLTTSASNHMNQQNGPQIAVLSDLNRQDITKTPQKAIVKPQILTHVIDGYIIQESPNPFPVNGLSYNSDQKVLEDEKNNNSIQTDIKSKNKNENTLNSNPTNPSSSRNRTPNEKQICINCGSKRKSNAKNSRTLKRFCSQSCSEKYNFNNDVNNTSGPRLALYNAVTSQLDNTDLQRGQELAVDMASNETEKQTSVEKKKKIKCLKRSHENTNELNNTKNGEINATNDRNAKKVTQTTQPLDVINDKPAPTVNCVAPSANEESNTSAIAGLYIPPGGRNPLQWSVNDVYDFVRNLQGCTEYADDFRSQEIDGQALMLIKEDHLMNTMNMKLGPALKICSKINALREDVQKI